MKHTMNLNPSPFDMIRSGRKTIELRLYDERRSLIREGDTILFTNTADTSRTIEARVVCLHRFPSFEELYRHLPLLQCGYTEEDIATAAASDMDVYYTREKQAQYGVVGIELALLDA